VPFMPFLRMYTSGGASAVIVNRVSISLFGIRTLLPFPNCERISAFRSRNRTHNLHRLPFCQRTALLPFA
jgi:hypothetical protein